MTQVEVTELNRLVREVALSVMGEKSGTMDPATKGRLDAIEARLSRGADHRQAESIGSRFIESSEYRASVAGKGATAEWTHEVKAVGTVILGTPPTSIAEVSYAGPALSPQFPPSLRSLIPSRPTATESILAVRESGSEGEAGVQVAEGDVKTAIDMKFLAVQFKLKTFNAYTKVSTQCLEDASWVESAVNSNIVLKIGQKEDKDWTAQLVAAATAGPVGVVGDTALDLIAAGQDTLAALGWTISGTLVNPADLALVRRVKDTTKNYIAVPAWIGPIVASPYVPATTYVTGAFSSAAVILDRDISIQILLGMTGDDFIHNQRCLLGERRSGLWIGQPSGFVKGSLIAPPV